MKKYYKLLIVILLSFFVGVFNVYASPPIEPSHDGYYFSRETKIFNADSISIGEYIDANIYDLKYKEEEYVSTHECTFKGYFNTMEDKEVVLEAKGGASFLITDDFIPNSNYELYKMDVDCKGVKGTLNFVDQPVYKNRVYVLGASPVRNGLFDFDATVHKNDKFKIKIFKDADYESRKNNKVLDINYDSFTVYYGFKDDYIAAPVDKIGTGEYQIDLKKATGKIESNKTYNPFKVEMVVNGKKYTFARSDYLNFDRPEDAKYSLNYSGALNTYEEAMSSISIDKTNAKYNESVYLNMKTSSKPLSGSIQFRNTKTKETFNSTLRDIDSKPYFVVPCTVPEGEYELYYISLKMAGTYQGIVHDWADKETTLFNYFFDKTAFEEKFLNTYIDYKYKINIEKDDGTIRAELLELDNKKITDEILTNIKKLDGDVKINVDASNDTKIKKELFEAIKGSDKTLTIRFNNHEWVIKGKDVKNVKDIDVKIDIKDTEDYEDIDKKVENAIVLEFADNGELPGKSKIKIYNDAKISEIIEKKDINLYLYDKESKRFTPVSSDIKLDEEGFYELELDHNSTYVITNIKIKDKYLAGNNDTLIMIILIVAAIVTVLLIGLVVFLLIRNKKKKKQQEPVVEPTPVEKTEEEAPIEEEKKEE